MNQFKQKKVLVTGGTGMIGRELVDLLLLEDANVTVASIDDGKNLPKGVTFLRLDLREYSNCVAACKGMDYVFNLVGVKASPKMCAEQPSDIMVPMIQFNTNMAEAARRACVEWYLYTSSVGVYYPKEILTEDDVWETFPSKNDWFGGWAKRMGELQLQAYSVKYPDIGYSIVRPANVYGSYDNFDPENAMVVPSLIRKAFENDKLNVWGDGSPIRDFIHARDVARGMMFAVRNKIRQPINLGSGEGVSISALVEVICECMPKNIKVVWEKDKPTGDKKRILDMSRAFDLGFENSVSLKEGISETVRWFTKNRSIVDHRYNAFK
jgi:GDP-L-fucose synthase